MTVLDDDDLPVLTQVLRTGDGRVPRRDGAGTQDTPDPSRESEHPGFGAGFNDTGADRSMPRALVIGSDPEARPDDAADVWRDASAIRRAAAPSAEVADTAPAGFVVAPAAPDAFATGVGGGDVFMRSAPPDAVFVDPIDEPPLIDRLHATGAEDEPDDVTGTPAHAALSRDVPLAFGDPAASPAAAAVATAPTTSASTATAATIATTAAAATTATTSAAAREYDASLALQVRDSVLQELSARIDTELDARIAQTLHAALETALAHLQTSLRVELAEALRDVVSRAVDDAVRRLHDRPPTAGGA